MNRVLVTGAAGFIGSHLCDALLAAGSEVVGVDSLTPHYDRTLKLLNLEPARNQKGFTFIEADLADPTVAEAVGGCAAVYHLAARPGVRDSWDDFSDYVDSNITGTKAILDACIASGDVRLVYASSSSVYGDAERLPVTEDDRLAPVSPYGASKVMTETLARAYAAAYDLDAVGLRYFTVYGPRQRPDMAFSRFIAAATAGNQIGIFGDGRQLRDFTYVGDIVAATIAAASEGRAGAVYNVASGHPFPLIDVIDKLGAVLGARLDVRFKDVQRGDVRDTHASIERAAAELGYAPSTSLEEGLSAQVAEAERRREVLAAA